ncbi:MAG: hypothetical protein RR977_04425, partial [Oscillospiraceae bacterium]
MEQLKERLIQYHKKYPLMEIADMVKLLFQNEFAGGHFIANASQSEKRLWTEWHSLNLSNIPKDLPLYEDIGNHLCRIHLARLSEKSLPLVHRMFLETANHWKSSMSDFLEKLSLLETLCADGTLPIPAEEAHLYLKEYRAIGCPMLSHSNRYRQQYHPSYRIIEKRFAVFFTALEAIDEQLAKDASSPFIVAVEGRCASGKTYLSDTISSLFDCSVFHMDDFFLPPDLRTDKRLSSPGENIHHERFLHEVLQPIKNGLPACYRPFSCTFGTFGEDVIISPKRLTIIEGSYSLHPSLRPYYDYKIFVSVDAKTQQERIGMRNGSDALKMFLSRWI